MDITFLGAAGTVTGSRYLVEAAGRRLLVDCGLFQGLKQLRLRNREPFAVPPAEIEAVVLTHAHLDHSGYLPALARDGFRGPIYCTPATAELCAVLLPDSGHLQEEEARFAAEAGYSKHDPPLPLYTRWDAERCLEQLRPVELHREVEPFGGVGFTLRGAGHLLGATSVVLRDGSSTAVFSGDIGRPDDAVLAAPEPAPAGDLLVVESTYGDRLHPQVDAESELEAVVNRTAARGGSVLIPAFAVGRAQALVLLLHRLTEQGRIPRLPTFVDSPMAIEATEVFRRHPEAHRLSPAEADAVATFAQAARTREDSKRVGRMNVPRIVISASGMATGGRVLHHLKTFAPDRRNTILLAGYQAAGTRGAQLVAGAADVKIHGARIAVHAEVAQLRAASGHADAAELIAWMRQMPSPPRQVYITHGEPVAADALRLRIQEELGWTAAVAEHGQRVTVATPLPATPEL